MTRLGKTLIFILLCISVLGVVVFLYFKIVAGFEATERSWDKKLPNTYFMPSEDSLIIGSRYLSKLKVYKVIHFKNKEPVSIYENDRKFSLILIRLKLPESVPLKDFVNLSFESTDRTVDQSYFAVGLNNFCEFGYRVDPPKDTARIFLTLYGDSLKATENDSIKSYYLSCKNMSLRYSKPGPIDVYMQGVEKGLGLTEIFPLELVLLKRKYATYFLLLTPDDPKSDVSPDLLTNIVLNNPGR